LASALQQDDFNVRLLDMRIEDYHHYSIGNPLFVGISATTGQQIKYALDFAHYARTQNPSALLVWGGVHPTLLPEQTARNDYVDVVVRGEGEAPIKDLANALYEDQPLDEVLGLTYKVNNAIKNNPEGKTINLDDVPVDLPYDLLPMDRYPSFRLGRFPIQTSRGCPHRCSFCYNSHFNHAKWRGKTPDRVLDEIQWILNKYPHIKLIAPIDDNVFVDEHRIKQICEGLLDRKLRVQWRANCRFDYLATYSQDFLELIEESGCVELDFGGESGSERLQTLICKDVTADEMLQSVENLKRHASTITPCVSWMSGLPGETDADLIKTFDLMDKMSQVNPKTQHYGIFVYTPFPSSVMECLPHEFTAPQSLEEWGNINIFHFDPPWHTKEQSQKLHTISAVTHIAFYPQARVSERNFTFKFAYLLMNRMAKYRWKHRNFSYPVELKIVDAVAKHSRGIL